jgi:DNA-binding response OmpR family regulator
VPPDPQGRLLVFSTDSVCRDLLAVILKSKGFRVIEAHSESQVREQLSGAKFPLAFLDLRLQALSARDAGERLLADFPGQRFVVLVDERDGSGREELVSLGAEAVLSRPFENDSLGAVLAGCGVNPAGGR